MNRKPRAERQLERLIDLYVLRSEVEGKSPITVQAYRDTLQRFLRIARDEAFPTDVAAITAAHLYSYLGRYTDTDGRARYLPPPRRSWR